MSSVLMQPVILSTPGEFEEALALRYRVFCDEQGIARENERDLEDDFATHAVIRDEAGRVIATGRAVRQLPDGSLHGLHSMAPASIARIGRMAVGSEARRRGLGARVLTALEREAASAGLVEVQLHAQLSAVPFYESCGYASLGEVFVEENIPHIEMTKRLVR